MTDARHELNEAVQISVPSLVRLNRSAASLPLHAGRILARLGGDYQSPFKGRGMEFDESRLYQPGDDIRNIDWRVTARTGKPHTKLFREERERPVFVWVDFRRPMFFATRGRYKVVTASQLASLLAWSAVYQGDRIGGVIFSEEVHHELRPMRGRGAALRLIRQMVEHPAWQAGPGGGEEANAGTRAIARLRRVARPGSLVFLLSDFREFGDASESQLILLGRTAEVFMILLYDPLERELPPPGRYPLTDGRREFLLDTFHAGTADAYRRRFDDRLTRLRSLAHRHGMHFSLCSTRDDPFAALQTALTAGRRR